MKRIVLPLLFLACSFASNAQSYPTANIANLERDNGYLNLQLWKTKTDFKELFPAEDTNEGWLISPPHQKHIDIFGAGIIQEYVRFDANDSLREVTIYLPPAQKDEFVKNLLKKVAESYGDDYQTLQVAPKTTIYLWQATTVRFFVYVTRSNVVPGTYDTKVTYSHIGEK